MAYQWLAYNRPTSPTYHFTFIYEQHSIYEYAPACIVYFSHDYFIRRMPFAIYEKSKIDIFEFVRYMPFILDDLPSRPTSTI